MAINSSCCSGGFHCTAQASFLVAGIHPRTGESGAQHRRCYAPPVFLRAAGGPEREGKMSWQEVAGTKRGGKHPPPIQIIVLSGSPSLPRYLRHPVPSSSTLHSAVDDAATLVAEHFGWVRRRRRRVQQPATLVAVQFGWVRRRPRW